MSEHHDVDPQFLPFLPIASRGGPFDDDAYMAGFQAGMLYTQLGAIHRGIWALRVIVMDANAAQADLFAMHYGWHVVSSEPSETEGYTHLVLHRNTAVPEVVHDLT